MVFGDSLRAADTVGPAAWLEQSCQGEWWTVGALVPNHYESLLRVYAPAPCPGEWWSTYRELFAVVASIGERSTATPDQAWFAIWDGHGFDGAEIRVAWSDPPRDETERQARDAERAQLRDESRRRNVAVRSALDQIPRFDRPHRTYYLLEGPVRAVNDLRHPYGDRWRNPDLFWPDDQEWFVATDVDFWSLYIGGRSSFIAELAESVSTRAETVTLDLRLETED